MTSPPSHHAEPPRGFPFLMGMEAAIHALSFQQILVRALLHQLPIDGTPDAQDVRCQTMGNDDDRAAFADLRHVLLNHRFRLIWLNALGGFIEDENPWIGDQRTASGNARPGRRTARARMLSDQRVIPLRQFKNELVGACHFAALDDAVHREPRIGQGDVVETERLKRKFSCTTTPTCRRNSGWMLRQIDAIDHDSATFRNMQTLNQFGDGALARSGPTDDADDLPRLNDERDLVDELPGYLVE